MTYIPYHLNWRWAVFELRLTSTPRYRLLCTSLTSPEGIPVWDLAGLWPGSQVLRSRDTLMAYRPAPAPPNSPPPPHPTALPPRTHNSPPSLPTPSSPPSPPTPSSPPSPPTPSSPPHSHSTALPASPHAHTHTHSAALPLHTHNPHSISPTHKGYQGPTLSSAPPPPPTHVHAGYGA